MADVQVSNVVKRFGETSVLKGIDLHIQDGEFLTLIGASGCGKSTLLRIIAGLEPQTAGSIAIGGQVVDHLRPMQRRIAMVFQSYALYPHMTARENIATPLVIERTWLPERLPLLRLFSPRRAALRDSIEQDVQRVASQLQIEHLLSRRPSQLSGGQRQRVALGRAMVREPQAFLMDEPLSNLDASLRVRMRSELADLHRRLGATFIYVTHDQVEAMTMSDRVALMHEGEILQVGPPSMLYSQPANLRVARFLGSPRINVFQGALSNGRLAIDGAAIAGIPGGESDRPIFVGVRPEGLKIAPSDDQALTARLLRIEDLGHEAIIHARHDASDDAGNEIRVRLSEAEFAEAREAGYLGDVIALAIADGRIAVFEQDGARADLEVMANADAPSFAVAGG